MMTEISMAGKLYVGVRSNTKRFSNNNSMAATTKVYGRLRAKRIFFFNDTATTEIYPLSLHDAFPICAPPGARGAERPGEPRRGDGPRRGRRDRVPRQELRGGRRLPLEQSPAAAFGHRPVPRWTGESLGAGREVPDRSPQRERLREPPDAPLPGHERAAQPGDQEVHAGAARGALRPA